MSRGHPKLTTDHLELLRHVMTERREAEAIPTNADLARSIGVSVRTISGMIRRLDQDRAVERDRRARAFRHRATATPAKAAP